MKLVNDWKKILVRAWSVWCMYAIAFLSMLPMIFAVDWPWWIDIVVLLLSLAAIASRVTPQKAFRDE
jgi:hypothetical protein